VTATSKSNWYKIYTSWIFFALSTIANGHIIDLLGNPIFAEPIFSSGKAAKVF